MYLAGWSTTSASACNTKTTQNQPHQISNTQRTDNKMTDVVIQQHGRKPLMMDILMPETCWARKKWNKIASDIKLVFHSSTITMIHGPINTEDMESFVGMFFVITEFITICLLIGNIILLDVLISGTYCRHMDIIYLGAWCLALFFDILWIANVLQNLTAACQVHSQYVPASTVLCIQQKFMRPGEMDWKKSDLKKNRSNKPFINAFVCNVVRLWTDKVCWCYKPNYDMFLKIFIVVS